MDEPVYEMLWDCEFCSTRKLLGKTHRYCPNCGAPQNPAKRYFPTEEEKIAVEEHEYHGADRLCVACRTANHAKTKFCVGCGGPMEGAKSVALVSGGGPEGPDRAAMAEVKEWEKREHAGKLKLAAKAGAGLLVLAALVLLGLRLSSKEVELSVNGHHWEREIEVESFRTMKETSWCDSMPLDAYDVLRTREVRSHESVPDGEDCKTVRKDRGDGTFSEEEQCAPRYRQEPVYDHRCRYSVDRWARARSENARGGLSDPPAWPKVRLKREGACEGCEREGARKERFTVAFDDKGKTRTCLFGEDRWRSMAPGSKWKGKVNRLTGLDCSGLTSLP
ncbi:MAG: zinc ribbon domain-containing protein [Elusimicrobia bacterium]|nr:zinc ribbon domain-containing protein [Elusimicrobiota bacterium]